jgi:ABC-type branched-subunit amino acid transport system substrate-binding protein
VDFSIEQGDTFFFIGSRQLVAYQLGVDYVNRYGCGITVNGENYAIELASYDDQSSTVWTQAIAMHIVTKTAIDVLFGGYSSALTAPLAAVANNASRLLLAPGAAATSVFAGWDGVFGMFPPTSKYLSQAVEGLSGVGAKTIATVWEDASFTRGLCAAAPDLAKTHGLELTSSQEVESSPNVTVLQAVAEKLAKEDPDVNVACVYDGSCLNWVQVLKNIKWPPKAQVFTVCVGLHSFASEVITPEYRIRPLTCKT